MTQHMPAARPRSASTNPKRKLDPSRRRTRYDPPTLDEAVFAAQGLTDDVEGQVEIAAQLIGLPEGEVRPAVLQAKPASRAVDVTAGGTRRAVIVERKGPRLLAASRRQDA